MIAAYLEEEKGEYMNDARDIFTIVKGLALQHPEERSLQLDCARAAYNLLSWYAKNGIFDRAREMYQSLERLSTENDREVRLLLAKGAVNLLNHGDEGYAPFLRNSRRNT
jgi:hypothetical protein